MNLNLKTTAIAFAIAVILPGMSFAAGYPNKTITFICPYSAGGGGDTASRMIAKIAGDIMGVKINVENSDRPEQQRRIPHCRGGQIRELKRLYNGPTQRG